MNPYSEPQVNEPLTGNDLFGNFRYLHVKHKQTERGSLLRYFCKKLGMDVYKDIGFVAFKVTGMNLQDLYYLKSICDRYENEGQGSWSKCFNGSLKVR